jgi:flavin reductase (DIM6/NTAB) family NADH-FMN oxidoreductase RutF
MNRLGFQAISAEEIGNAITLIGNDWMLITAKDEENNRANAMTASWGCMGVLWNKPVCVCFIRPQRHTFALAEKSDHLSLAFFGDKHRDALKLCGTKSGKDLDKLTASGLHTSEKDGVPFIEEAELVLFGRKIYVDDLKEDSFLDPSLLSHYRGDYHRIYVLEIESAYRKIIA